LAKQANLYIGEDEVEKLEEKLKRETIKVYPYVLYLGWNGPE